MGSLYNHIADSHCHLDINCNSKSIDGLVKIIGNSKIFHDQFFHVMATNHIDLDLVDTLCTKLGKKYVVPYFGIHPWFSHLFTLEIYDDNLLELTIKQVHYRKVLKPEPSSELLLNLPKPINLELYLEKISKIAGKYKIFGIGEIGLDKAFRVPLNGFLGNPDVPNTTVEKLSPCRVDIVHQNSIFQKQLDLADKLKKQVSLHCVKAHGLLFDSVKNYVFIPSIILHSYSGSVDQAKMWIKFYKKSSQSLYFSLSNWINGNDQKRESLTILLKEIEAGSILLETDFSIDCYLQEAKFQQYLDELVNIFDLVCSNKQWSLQHAKDVIFNNIKNSIGYN